MSKCSALRSASTVTPNINLSNFAGGASPSPLLPQIQALTPQAQQLNPLAQVVGPVNPSPSPFSPLPNPLNPFPNPLNPLPAPVQPLPQPVQPLPQPVQPLPQPVQPLPQPVQPLPQPVTPVPRPIRPIPAPVPAPSYQPGELEFAPYLANLVPYQPAPLCTDSQLLNVAALQCPNPNSASCVVNGVTILQPPLIKGSYIPPQIYNSGNVQGFCGAQPDVLGPRPYQTCTANPGGLM